jgi:hypothetical protein
MRAAGFTFLGRLQTKAARLRVNHGIPSLLWLGCFDGRRRHNSSRLMDGGELE